MRTSIVALLASVLVSWTSTLQAQQVPLPQDMVATFPSHHMWAEELWLPTLSPDDIIRATISFENSEASNRVTIDWYFEHSGAQSGAKSQSFDTAYRPTAIARRAGKTLAFYVVGWSDRTSRVVVEKWSFGQYLLGTATPAGLGTVVSTLGLPPITRVIEWVSDAGAKPIWDAACQTYGNALLMLSRGSPTRIWSLNLQTGMPTVLYSSETVPALAGHRMLVVGRHGSDGFLAISEPRRVWDPPEAGSPGEVYFVMKDQNCDGVFESSNPLAPDQLYVAYPPPWNNKYVEP